MASTRPRKTIRGLFASGASTLRDPGQRQHQVGVLISRERQDHVIEPLDALEAANEEEIRTLMRMANDDDASSSDSGSGKEGNTSMLEREFAVLAATELAHCDESVDVVQLPFEIPGISTTVADVGA